MTTETRRLYEQHASANKHIVVDPFTGKATVTIPVAELHGDDGFAAPYKVQLGYTASDGLQLMLSGAAEVEGGKGAYVLTLADGRRINHDGNEGTYTVGDMTIECKTPTRTVPGVHLVGFRIVHKSGVVEYLPQFQLLPAEFQPRVLHALLGGGTDPQTYTFPSGKMLTFTISDYQVKISADKEVLVEVNYQKVNERILALENTLKSIIVYPQSTDEKKTLTFTPKTANSLMTYAFEIDGYGGSGKVLYTLNTDAQKRLTKLAIEKQHPLATDAKQIAKTTYSESLGYASSGKVSSYTVAPGAGMDALHETFDYSGDTTTVTGSFQAAGGALRQVFQCKHQAKDGRTSTETYNNGSVAVSRTHAIKPDTKRKLDVCTTVSKEGTVVVDQREMEIDPLGNPARRVENDLVTRWTYYNNYQQYRVTETQARYEDWSFFGVIWKTLDYLNPIGASFAVAGLAGADVGGLTWGSRITSTVEMSPVENNYAEKAFNLPTSITHTGSNAPFSGHLESELVCRKVGDKLYGQQLTFFGYSLLDGHIRPSKKLTILQPDYEEIDDSAEQLNTAKAAAQEFITSLQKQRDAESDKAKKQGYEDALSDLNNSLARQSKANSRGFKLKSWKNASMTVEALDYYLDKSKPGYGMVSQSKAVMLNDKGQTVGTPVVTLYKYSVDAKDPNRLTITTTARQETGEGEVVSSQVRSRRSGRLYESTDSKGVKTVYTYDRHGNPMSEIASDGGKQTSKIEHSFVADLHSQWDHTVDGQTTRLVTDPLGRNTGRWFRRNASAGFLKTASWSHDASGRLTESSETDYGLGDKTASTRIRVCAYDDAAGKTTLTHTLKDGSGKQLDQRVQVMTALAAGETFTQGTFSMTHQLNDASRTLSERFVTTGSTGALIERVTAADGLSHKVKYSKLDKDAKATEIDTVNYGLDGHGQLVKIEPKDGCAATYAYDCAGRLVSTTRDGVMLRNSYSSASVAPVALSGSVKAGSAAEISLGTQEGDWQGRVIKRSVNGSSKTFSYRGAAREGAPPSLTGPGTVAGYSASTDVAARTHTQKVKDGSKSLDSSVVLSSMGRVLSFTAFDGQVTTYEYDVFDRVVKSTNASCESSFTFGDNGLLLKETIKAVKQNLTMTVTYTYDELGQETRRNFECPGVDTIRVDRTLRHDGRVSHHTVSVTKAQTSEYSSENFTYDGAGRLSAWVASGAQNLKENFTYDGLGNLTKRVRVGGTDTFTVDSNKAPGALSHLDSSAQQFDGAGRMTGGSGRKITWHANGQVATYSADDGKTTYTFNYDDSGRVRGGSRDKWSDAYHYRGNCVYAVCQKDGARQHGFSERSMILRNDSRGCWMQDTVIDAKAVSSFQLRDASGTVFMRINLQDRSWFPFDYTPYGNRKLDPSLDNWLGFKGEPLNCLGLYHLGNGYRLYDPSLGRFLSPDSLSPFGAGGAAAYVFGAADPVNHCDPSGHQTIAQYERWGSMPVMYTTGFRISVGAVGVVLAPFTAGASAALIVASTALAIVAFAFDLAAIILSESDPELSRTLESWGEAFAITGAAAGIAMTAKGFMNGTPRNLTRVRGTVSDGMRPSRMNLADIVTTQALYKSSIKMDLIGLKTQALRVGYLRRNFFNSLAFADSPPLGGAASNLARLSRQGKQMFTGSITQFDDSLADALGTQLDIDSGPNTLIQKFEPVSEADASQPQIVAGPSLGRDTPI